MDGADIPRGGQQGSIGLDVLGADDITNHIGIGVLLTLGQRGPHQRDHIGLAIGRDDKRRYPGRVAGDLSRAIDSVEHRGTVKKRVANVDIRNAGK